MTTIRLSLKGGSGKSIETLAFCPKKYYWMEMCGIYLRRTPTYFVTGRVFHEEQEKKVQKLIGEEAKPERSQEQIEDIFRLGRVEGESAEAEDVLFDPDEKAGKILNQALCKSDEVIHAADFGTPIDTEMFVQTVPINPESGKQEPLEWDDGEIIWSGKIDCLLTNIEGLLEINDWKHCKTEMKQHEVEYSPQLTMYSYLWWTHSQKLVWDTAIRYYTKHVGGCRTGKLKVLQKGPDWAKLYRSVREMSEELLICLQKDTWPQRGILKGCAEKFNQLCPYHHLCFPHKYGSDAELEANEKLKVYK